MIANKIMLIELIIFCIIYPGSVICNINITIKHFSCGLDKRNRQQNKNESEIFFKRNLNEDQYDEERR